MSRVSPVLLPGRAAQSSRRRRTEWPVRIAVAVLCLLWAIPTAGTVITSFRTSDAANSSGWWRALTAPLDTSQYTLLNYRFAWTGGMATS